MLAQLNALHAIGSPVNRKASAKLARSHLSRRAALSCWWIRRARVWNPH